MKCQDKPIVIDLKESNNSYIISYQYKDRIIDIEIYAPNSGTAHKRAKIELEKIISIKE